MFQNEMGDVSGRDAHRWMRWFLRFTNQSDEATQSGSETDTGSYSGISGLAWRDARNTTRTMAILMQTDIGDAIPELPRTILEADSDGCVRWIVRVQPEQMHGLEEPMDVLIWLWADGSVHLAFRPAFHTDWSWSPPVFPDRV